MSKNNCPNLLHTPYSTPRTRDTLVPFKLRKRHMLRWSPHFESLKNALTCFSRSYPEGPLFVNMALQPANQTLVAPLRPLLSTSLYYGLATAFIWSSSYYLLYWQAQAQVRVLKLLRSQGFQFGSANLAQSSSSDNCTERNRIPWTHEHKKFKFWRSQFCTTRQTESSRRVQRISRGSLML